MDGTRRDFTGVVFSSALVLAGLPRLATADTAVRGVKLGITTGSLNPLPDFPDKNRLDILVEECAQLECGNIELAAGFFGPSLQGAAIGGQVPKTITPEFQKIARATAPVAAFPGGMGSGARGPGKIRGCRAESVLHVKHVCR